VAKPLLDLGDVGVVIEGVCRRRGAKSMGADIEAEQDGIAPHQPVDPVRRD